MDITTELKHEATLLRTAEAIIQSVREERDWFKRQLEKRDAEVERLRADAERWAAVKRMRWDDLRRLKEQPDHCDFTERFDAARRG